MHFWLFCWHKVGHILRPLSGFGPRQGSGSTSAHDAMAENKNQLHFSVLLSKSASEFCFTHLLKKAKQSKSSKNDKKQSNLRNGTEINMSSHHWKKPAKNEWNCKSCFPLDTQEARRCNNISLESVSNLYRIARIASWYPKVLENQAGALVLLRLLFGSSSSNKSFFLRKDTKKLISSEASEVENT